MENIEIIMDIIVHGGNARSKAMEAIRQAAEGKFEEAKKQVESAEEDLHRAHNVQTSLIQDEANGKKTEISLLMIHAQDHLMNAITVVDMAKEMIRLHEMLFKIKNQ